MARKEKDQINSLTWGTEVKKLDWPSDGLEDCRFKLGLDGWGVKELCFFGTVRAEINNSGQT